MKKKKVNKIPIRIFSNGSDENIYLIEIKKTSMAFEEGELYEINRNLMEEVSEDLWNNLLN